MKTIKKVYVFGNRPNVPDGLIIRSAHILSAANGKKPKFIDWSSVFPYYAFVANPSDIALLSKVADYDAHIAVYYSEQDVLDWAKSFLREIGAKPEDYSFAELRNVYTTRMSREDGYLVVQE